MAIRWHEYPDARCQKTLWYPGGKNHANPADNGSLYNILWQIDWEKTACLCHHAQFDGLILSHHYGIKPKFWFDSLSTARLLLGNHLSVGLDSLAKHYGLAAKTVPYNLFRGKHWEELPDDIRQQVGDGAIHDVELTWQLFQILGKQMPKEEFSVVDQTIRMFTEQVLRADLDMLATLWETENRAKVHRLESLGVAAADLASADRFADLLRAEGVEPETKPGKVKDIYAFAKTDEFMRGLLEHDSERVRTLAEARLGEKSTLLQTRAETLGYMAQRGPAKKSPLCVYLNYAGAGTLRPSGGDKSNFLNMKRFSPIRRAILAPEGYYLAPVDSSQIEVRCLHYLAGDEEMMQKFREGEDPYVDLASKFYDEKIYKPEKTDPRKDEMEMKRGAGKQARLMCLGPETLVLTDNGVKPITTIELADRLWDGREWVEHQGLVKQGKQNTIQVGGVWMTPEHSVLCGNLWMSAIRLQNAHILSLALARGSANLPSQVTSWASKTDLKHLWRNVRAEHRNTSLTPTILSWGAALDATLALKRHPDIGQKNITGTQMSARMNRIDDAFWDELAQFTRDVKAKIAIAMKIMVAEEYKFANNGKTTAANSWPTLSRSPAGIIQIWKLIASTIKKAIGRVTSASLQKEPTTKIKDDLEISRKRLPTYDIACAGPRNRFTVVSCAGLLIVHNCGYGAAGPKYKATAKAGLYGPPIDMTLQEAERQVRIYREETPSVCAKNTGYWAQASRMLARLAGGDALQWGPLLVKDHRIYLPNGAPLIYDTLMFHRPGADEEVKEFERDGYWRVKTRRGWKTMWGSKLTQNICEAVSRVIISQAMIRISRLGFRTLNWPYDELLLLIPKDADAERNLELCKAEMVRTPDWLPGIPLACEGELSERYSK